MASSAPCSLSTSTVSTGALRSWRSMTTTGTRASMSRLTWVARPDGEMITPAICSLSAAVTYCPSLAGSSSVLHSTTE